MIGPPGVDLVKHMQEASLRFNPFWFYRQVRRTGPWDYRFIDESYRGFGNYHYGAVACAMGHPRWLILRAAGWEHWWSGRSTRPWGKPWGQWPHGDDPDDSLNIFRGILDATDRGLSQPILSRVAWRAFDVTVASLILLLTWPATFLLAELVLATSGRPAFDGSWRLGQYGKSFRCWKLRTLKVDHEAIFMDHFRKYPASWLQWKTYRKLDPDPRATRIGRWLRKTSLDDLLPQAWNILKGDMAVFGPRAFLVSEGPDLGKFKDRILMVKPGWISYYGAYGRARMPFAERVRLEAEYARTMRQWGVKAKALCGTVRHCLWGTGA